MRPAELRKVVDKIETAVQTPKQFFDMGDWAENVYAAGDEPCGTAACFAGYAVPRKYRELFVKGEFEQIEAKLGASICEAAQKKFGLNDDQSGLLFATCEWPEKFRMAYYAAESRANRARIGTKKRIRAELRKVNVLRKRVEHFIKTKGAE